jgi:hypothetical protein
MRTDSSHLPRVPGRTDGWAAAGLLAEPAVRDREARSDCPGNDACDDEDPLLPGGGHHLGHHSDGENDYAENRRGHMSAHYETEREGANSADEGEDSEGVQHWVALAIAVQGEAGHVSLRLRLGLRLRADF